MAHLLAKTVFRNSPTMQLKILAVFQHFNFFVTVNMYVLKKVSKVNAPRCTLLNYFSILKYFLKCYRKTTFKTTQFAAYKLVYLFFLLFYSEKNMVFLSTSLNLFFFSKMVELKQNGEWQNNRNKNPNTISTYKLFLFPTNNITNKYKNNNNFFISILFTSI